MPKLTKVDDFYSAVNNNYYIFSSDGIPSIYDDMLRAIDDINENGKYDYLVICLDAEEISLEERQKEIFEVLNVNGVSLEKAKLEIFVQNCCLETWFLGNRKVYSRNIQNHHEFLKYARFYNVSLYDPELMKKPKGYEYSIAYYHLKYLKAMFQARNISYSKNNSKEVQSEAYLEELKKRLSTESNHLNSLRCFVDFCAEIKNVIDL
ncbi:MAG: hypothetical protein L3V56_06750 [Candidatus Magnetoovum sp. WYHC-5]|nr:hypothetical protein [Candidatus Magnetoovum sp. WYHC-5]